MIRAAEAAVLDDVVERACAGRGGAVLVVGGGGVGKSHLLRRAASTAQQRGCTVLRGQGWREPSPVPLRPWTQALAPLAEELAAAGGPAVGPGFGGREASVALLRSGARRRPLVLVLDDLHPSDEESLVLLGHAARALAGAPVGFVAACRPLPAFPTAAGDAVGVLTLAGLRDDDVAELASARTGRVPGDEEVAGLLAATAGNPLLVIDVVDTGWQPPAPAPPRSTATLGPRLEELDAVGRAAVDALVVLGERADLALVAAVAGVGAGPAGVGSALGAAGELVVLDGGAARFVHDLARQVVDDALAPGRRGELHGRAADALVERWAGLAEEHAAAVAGHLCAAGPARTADAVRWAALAGRRAAAAGDAEAAARWAALAVDLVPRADHRARCELLLEVGSARTAGNRSATAVGTFEEALVEAERSGDPILRARAAVGLADARWRAPGEVSGSGMVAAALAAASAALPTDEHGLRAAIAEQRARAASIGGDVDLEVAAVDAAVAGVPPEGPAAEAAARARRWSLAGPAPLADKRAASAVLLDRAVRGRDARARWEAHRWALVDALEAGDGRALEVHRHALRQLAGESGEPFVVLTTDAIEASIALLEGRFGEARALGERTEAAMVAAELDASALLAQRAAMLRDVGRADELVALLVGVGAVVPDRSSSAQALRALVLAEAGDVAGSNRALDRLHASAFLGLPRDTVWLNGLTSAAGAAVLAGHRRAAAALLDILAPYRDRCVVAGPVGRWLFGGAVAHHTGALAGTVGDLDAAVADLTVAEDLHRRLGARPWLARTLVQRSAVLRRRGAPGDARAAGAALAEGAELAASLGMAPLAAAARAASADGEPDRPVIVAEGGLWRVSWPGGRTVRLPDSKGLRCLRHLLARPGEEVPATDLVIEALGEPAPDAERARVNVTRQLRSAAEALAAADPALGDHLRVSLRTGGRCAYAPPQGVGSWWLAPNDVQRG